jgi:hypothetical protein
MNLPSPLTQAYRRRRLLILWADLPLALAAQPPANRLQALHEWQSRTPPLRPELAEGWVRLPPLPVLSLDPTNRIEQLLSGAGLAFRRVCTRQDLPGTGQHSLLKLAGDLDSRTGLIFSRAELNRLRRDPDKQHLLAEARRIGEGGAILCLGADPVHPDFLAWWAVLAPALGQSSSFALGNPSDAWPDGITPLAVEPAALAEALAAIALEPPETVPVDSEQLSAQLNARLDDLSDQLAQSVAELKRGQAVLYRRVGPARREELAQILAALQQDRLAQAEMQATLVDLRRAMQVILNRGVPMDPELRAAIADLTEAVESSLSLDQKLELALPLVPLLLNYKIELGAGSDLDLHDLWRDLQARWQRLIQAATPGKP